MLMDSNGMMVVLLVSKGGVRRRAFQVTDFVASKLAPTEKSHRSTPQVMASF
jgi:hypothetical protein